MSARLTEPVSATRIAIVVAVVLAILGVPGAAAARTATIGSSLAAPATLQRARPVDTALWPRRRAGGPAIDVPFTGQATVVRMKGGIVVAPGTSPFDLLHFQVLRRSGARWTVVVTSEDFHAPVFASPDTVTTFRSAVLCVRRGDRIALSNAGGFGDGYPQGVPFRVFGAVRGARSNAFTGAGRNLNGSRMRPRVLRGRELLVQATVVGGAAARPACR